MTVEITAQDSYFRVWTELGNYPTQAEAERFAQEYLAANPSPTGTTTDVSFDHQNSKRWHAWKQETQHTTLHKAKQSALNIELDNPLRVTRLTSPDLAIEDKTPTLDAPVGTKLRYRVATSHPAHVRFPPTVVEVEVLQDLADDVIEIYLELEPKP
jgi:hypothetical protein